MGSFKKKEGAAPSGAGSPEHDGSSVEIDMKKDKALIRKIDLHAIPFITLMYLFSFLDRGSSARRVDSAEPIVGTDMSVGFFAVNIGNARLYGLEEDLGLDGDQFQISVSILFVTYCVRPCRGLLTVVST
jgi:hypothetical protein